MKKTLPKQSLSQQEFPDESPNDEAVRAFLTVVVCLAVACAGCTHRAMPQPVPITRSAPPAPLPTFTLSRQDIAIFQVEIADFGPSDRDVFNPQTITSQGFAYLVKPPFRDTYFSSPQRKSRVLSLIARFKARNRCSQRLPSFPSSIPVVFVVHGAELVDRRSGSWDKFRKNHPGEYENADGLISLSLPCYTADGSAALVFFGYSGIAESVDYLVKVKGRWKVRASVAGWDV